MANDGRLSRPFVSLISLFLSFAEIPIVVCTQMQVCFFPPSMTSQTPSSIFVQITILVHCTFPMNISIVSHRSVRTTVVPLDSLSRSGHATMVGVESGPFRYHSLLQSTLQLITNCSIVSSAFICRSANSTSFVNVSLRLYPTTHRRLFSRQYGCNYLCPRIESHDDERRLGSLWLSRESLQQIRGYPGEQRLQSRSRGTNGNTEHGERTSRTA
jgi:hypothetical protein